MKPPIHRWLIHLYLIATVTGIVLGVPLMESMPAWLAIGGAELWWLALAYLAGETLPLAAGVICLLTIVVFPVLLVIFYILALKKKYLPFWILSCLETLVVLGMCAGNVMQPELGIPSSVISLLMAIALTVCLKLQNKKETEEILRELS